MEGTSEPPIPFGIYGDTGELFPGLDDAAVHNFAATAPREKRFPNNPLTAAPAR